ncbi:MAG: hemolysin family protein [Chitinophagales bacterium]|nr:hemolysin family protein [Chitinophagales bacterium]MDW8428173.1 hemolysin family protein [Chitinophagales bacterium]
MAFLVVIGLILLNGLFAMAEAALIAARRYRFEYMARKGSWKARIAFSLLQDPNKFLSTTQLGITLISIGAGAYGGTEIAGHFSEQFAHYPALSHYAGPLGMLAIVLLTTYLSMVIGELVPKTIGMTHAESIALWLAPLIQGLYYVTLPFIWLLTRSNRLVLWLLRVRTPQEPPITLEDLKIIIEKSRQQGVLEPQQSEILRRIVRSSDRTAGSVMTHRTDVIWLDKKADGELVSRIVRQHPHTAYPVVDKSPDQLVGVVFLKDLIDAILLKPFSLTRFIKKPLYVPETMPLTDLLEAFRRHGVHFAVVLNEYGQFEGVVTLHDVMEAIVGVIPDQQNPEEEAIRRSDGSWLMDGMLQHAKWTSLLNMGDLAELANSGYHTLGGFIMDRLGRIPRTGDSFAYHGYVFEVVDMDGLRVDKVLIRKQEK